MAAAAVLLAAILVPSVGATRKEYPTLYVQYSLNCTFTIVDESGNTVTSIPPGTYEVAVTTPMMFSQVNAPPGSMAGCKGYVQFQLTGPGVYLYTTLFQGCNSFEVLNAQQFKPSSTYVAQDNNQPSVARVTFTTLASGAPVAPPSPQGPGTGKGTPSTDLVGSQLVTQGSLAADVSPAGKLTLRYKGKAVSSLKAGRYTVSVTDESPKTAFIVQELHKVGTTVGGRTFVGKQTKTVLLKAGQWFFSSGAGGTKTYFIVTR
jgi:hypothetical protein